jgi:integrase
LEVTDLQDGAVSVTKSLEEISGKLRVKATKTRKSRRLIPLSAQTPAVLAQHIGERAQGPLFTDTDGGRLRIGNVTKRSFQAILARAGLGERTLYDLRHTLATLLLSANVGPKIVSERLGHSSVMLTRDTCSHVLPGMQDVVTANMGEWLQLGYSNGSKTKADARKALQDRNLDR